MAPWAQGLCREELARGRGMLPGPGVPQGTGWREAPRQNHDRGQMGHGPPGQGPVGALKVRRPRTDRRPAP